MNSTARKCVALGLISTVILTASIFPSTVVPSISVPSSAESFDGDFTSGIFDVWDGVSYDFSWFDPDADEYNITSAAQLASLSILTNDLSQGFSTWASTLPASCDSYKAVCYDFSGKTIHLAADIDLGNYSWLPISYPFDTPNITHGEFDALSHVPAYLTSVDPWVGDGEGHEIITRYLEYPESEMRFRDLLYYVNKDTELNALNNLTKIEKITSDNTSFLVNYWNARQEAQGNSLIHGWDRRAMGTFSLLNSTSYVDLGYYSEVNETGGGVSLVHTVATYLSYYLGDIEIPTYSSNLIRDTDIVASYTYKDVHSGGSTAGFNGTFDGQMHRIKGLHPDTPWTTDYLERLTTFDPIGKGLFGVLDADGIITNINISGAYTENDICSYSAFLCAYNYGTISNCYVHGNMEQGLVKQIYPLHRDYGKYSDTGEILEPSVYELSYTQGTVLPVGNSGFATAYNKGEIRNVITAGAVTQAFRQFGFITVTNDGVINNCENRASFEDREVTTTFTTDEWSYSIGGHIFKYSDHPQVGADSYFPLSGASMGNDHDRRNEFASAYRRYGFFKHDGFIPTSTAYFYTTGTDKPDKMAAYAESQGLSPQWGTETLEDWFRIIWAIPAPIGGSEPVTFMPSTSLVGFYQGSDEDGGVWVPELYNTNTGESIAANHLYGVYGLTAIGGICVVNNGSILSSSNTGALTSMHNTSGRYLSRQVNAGDTNYIRPCNAYGLFSTQINTVNYIAGICILNKGTVNNAVNSGNIIERDESTRDFVTVEDSPYAFLAYTNNGFYHTDCIAAYEEGIENLEFYPLASHWWWDWLPEDGEGQIKFYCDSRYVHVTQPDKGNSREVVRKAYERPAATASFSNPVRTYDNESVAEISFDEIALPDYITVEGNMPYPVYVKSFTKRQNVSAEGYNLYGLSSWANKSTFVVPAGICAYNIDTLDAVENTGSAKFGIVCISDGLTGTAYINDAHQNYNGSKENLAFILLNTNCTNSDVTNHDGADYGLARYVDSNNGTGHLLHQLSVYEGKSGFKNISADAARLEASNIFIYDTTQSGEGVSVDSWNVDFKDICNFQASHDGIGKISYCNMDNIWVYNTCENMGIASGIVADHLNNVNFFGDTAKLALGDLQYGTYTDITICTMDTSNALREVKGISKLQDANVRNMNVFALIADTGNTFSHCDILDSMFYLDTIDLGTSRAYYVNYVDNSHLKDVLLETKVNITETDPMDSGLANLPGVLKAYRDSNNFENVVVQTPDSCVTYGSFNFMSRTDKTIRSDAYLAKDEDARASGAMAYWADHGNLDTRTYNYTVALSDTIDFVPNAALSIIEPDLVSFDETSQHILPRYTRKIKDDTETSYYRVLIPYASKGAGEIKGTYVAEDDYTSTTKCVRERYPKTAIYVPAGKEYTLTVLEEPGYGLLHMWRNSASLGDNPEEVPFERNTPMPFVMPAEDLTYTSQWTSVYDISVADAATFVLTTSAAAAIPGETIYVDATILPQYADTTEIAEVWYYKYDQDEDNRWIINTDIRYEIPLDEMEFVMPECPVKIYAKTNATTASITRFTLGSTDGIINDDDHTIVVALDYSTDISSVAPSIFDTDAISVSPDPTLPQDFTKPVVYTLECENGDSISYTVTVIPLVDGKISYFELLGYKGIIDQDACTITVNLPLEMNLTSILPSISWSGKSITPSGAVNLTNGGTYTVISSAGEETVYTVIVNLPDTSTVISEFAVKAEDGSTLNFAVDDDTRTISATVPYGYDAGICTLGTFRYYGLESSMHEGMQVDLSTTNYITISDYEGNTVVYRLVLFEELSSLKILKQFTLYGIDAVIDQDNLTVSLNVPAHLDLRGIIPDAVVFEGASASELYASHDWLTDDVTFTITAYDGSSATYTVYVTQI